MSRNANDAPHGALDREPIKTVQSPSGDKAPEMPLIYGSNYVSYPKRWLVLFLFVMYSSINAFQWTQLVIITSILEKYYDVSSLSISWTSMIYMATYIVFILPATWFLHVKVSNASIQMAVK